VEKKEETPIPEFYSKRELEMFEEMYKYSYE
jgi:hypothetical protein